MVMSPSDLPHHCPSPLLTSIMTSVTLITAITPSSSGGHYEIEVEDMLDECICQGYIEYLVKWGGLLCEENTWQSWAYLDDDHRINIKL